MKVLYAIFEAIPFAKVGGLGDVGGALPKFLKKQRNDIRVIMPKHACIPERFKNRMKAVADFHTNLGWRTPYCGLQELEYNGVTYYFIDNEYYFKRDAVYGYDDDAERVAFFCRAALESLSCFENFKPQVIHCNDWHTSLIPVMLREFYGDHPHYYDIKTVMTIHNLKFQGIFSKNLLGGLLGMGHHTAPSAHLEWGDSLNFFKGGLIYSDAVTTVSPTYAREIQTPYYGEGLDGVLRWQGERLRGIINGIDYNSYNPSTDKALFRKYAQGDDEGKSFNKKALQELLNLPTNEDLPLFIMVSRLTEQKGLDLLSYILEELLSSEDIQFVALGTGDPQYEDMLLYFAGRFPHKMSVRTVFDDDLSRKFYAGGDFLVAPSRFEPCGVTQMIAMRYGTLPVVRETGGFKDTVIPYNRYTGEGNGFSFANYNAHELLFAFRRAARLYSKNQKALSTLRQHAYAADFSWEKSAEEYMQLYNEIIKKA
jgi:starch synthase